MIFHYIIILFSHKRRSYIRYNIKLQFVDRSNFVCPSVVLSLLLLLLVTFVCTVRSTNILHSSAIARLAATGVCDDALLLCPPKPLYNTTTSTTIATMTSEELIASLFPPNNLIDTILQVRGPFQDEEEEIRCKQMVESLEDDEIEIAARTSYSYWVKVVIFNGNDNIVNKNIQIRMAMREARRHYVGSNGNYESAFQNLKNTLHWRKENKVDLLRLVYLGDDKVDILKKVTNSLDDNDNDDIKIINKYRYQLENDLKRQIVVVRGHDKFNHAIGMKFPRYYPMNSADEEEIDEYRTAQIFMAEKAMAVTEIRSNGIEEKVIGAIDFTDYNSANAPPTSVMTNINTMLQANYPERAYRLILCDPPFWIRALLMVFKVFLAPQTQEKIVSVFGPDNKQEVIGELIDPEQAMEFLLPGGQLSNSIDTTKVLNQPFHLLYDDEMPIILQQSALQDEQQQDEVAA